MERKIIHGKEYIYDKVKVEDIHVMLLGAISDHNSDMVEFRSHRPKQDAFEGEILTLCSISEFMGELKYLCTYLDLHGISENSFIDGFLNLLDKHIKEIGRLIDSDLYSYIDKTIILQNSVYVSYGSQLKEDLATQIWNQLLRFAINKFRNHIFITQYDFANPSSPKPYLTKLSDIK